MLGGSDISRATYRQVNHYKMVLRQQGRVDVDADWNEQQEMLRHYSETEAIDVIGQSGVPDAWPNSFNISAGNNSAGASSLLIGTGRMYVDGILCENDGPAPVDVLNQPDLPAINNSSAGVVILPQPTAVYYAYLDVWLRNVNALDNPSIREAALGGPDTATRAKVVWQVKLMPAAPGAATPACGNFTPPPAPTGTLTASTVQPPAGGPCTIPPQAGYRRLDNQLYRVQIHQGSTETGGPTFKWSRENGSVITAVLGPSGSSAGPVPAGTASVTVADTGRDDNLGFHDNDWVEFLDDTADLNFAHGQLVQLATVNASTNTVTISASTPLSIGLTKNIRMRRWDQTGLSTGAGNISSGIPNALNTSIALENGLQIQFNAGTFNAGDYWLIPARTAVGGQGGNIEWPADASGNPASLLPMGVKHHYSSLAVVDYTRLNNGLPTINDCRKLFPPLTNLNLPTNDCDCCALNISPDPAGKWLTTLKGFNNSNSSQSVHICFAVGSYALDGPIVFKGLASVKITGGGAGTVITSPGEAAFIFSQCQSVDVSAISAVTQQATRVKNEAFAMPDPSLPKNKNGSTGTVATGLQGVLTFLGCPLVDVSDVSLTGVDGTLGFKGVTRTATCITVCNVRSTDTMPSTSVRIRHCNLRVGQYQVGILISNADRVQVEDNMLRVSPSPSRYTFPEILQDKTIRANIRRLLVSDTSLVPETKTTPAAPATPAATHEAAPVTAAPSAEHAVALEAKEAVPAPTDKTAPAATKPADVVKAPAVVAKLPQSIVKVGLVHPGIGTLQFQTPKALQAVWTNLIADPRLKLKPAELPQQQIKRIAGRLLVDNKLRKDFLPASDFIAGIGRMFVSEPVPAAQGIVVGGQVAMDVRIQDNTLTGFAEGIRVGQSVKDAPRNRRASAAGTCEAVNVSIRGNSIATYTSVALRAREGIFVGNCSSLLIQANMLSLTPAATKGLPSVDGIRIFGWLGNRVVVAENYLEGFSPSYNIFNLNTKTTAPALLVNNVP